MSINLIKTNVYNLIYTAQIWNDDMFIIDDLKGCIKLISL